MKKKDIFGVAPTYWKTTDLENLFDIRQDSRGLFIFNLNESMYLLIPDQACLFYTCQYTEMHWPLISYMIYGTTRLGMASYEVKQCFSRGYVYAEIRVGKGEVYRQKLFIADC